MGFSFNGIGIKDIEWNDVRMVIGGAQVVRFTGFEYGSTTEKEHLFTGGDYPIGIQSGNKKPEGSFTVLVQDFDTINNAAIAAGGDDVTDLVFDIAVTYKPTGTRPVQTQVVQGCEVKEWKKSMKQNDKKMEVTLPFLCMGIATV